MAGTFSPSFPAAPLDRLPSSPPASIHHEILLIEAEPFAAEHSAVLRQTSRVVSTAHSDVARQYLLKGTASLLVADTDGLPDADGIVRAAKGLHVPATVLVMTTEVNSVPTLLEAGCDAVLLKPFAPNLLYTRVGRLLRARTEQQRVRRLHDSTRSRYAEPNGHGNGDGAPATTNRFWADVECPHCKHDGVVSFEFASHRRAWYACLECKAVWMARRRE